MHDLLLVGGGGHCKAVTEVVERTDLWRIAGIIEPTGSPTIEMFEYRVIGRDNDLPDLRKSYEWALVTVGQIKSPALRKTLYQQLKSAGFRLPVVISPLAWVSPRARLGEGTVVMDFACVGAEAEVGANVIVNTRALIEHGCSVGDHSHIATAAVLNGDVQVGSGTFIGSGAICREGIRIGDHCIVGMGALVMNDLEGGTLLKGASEWNSAAR